MKKYLFYIFCLLLFSVNTKASIEKLYEAFKLSSTKDFKSVFIKRLALDTIILEYYQYYDKENNFTYRRVDRKVLHSCNLNSKPLLKSTHLWTPKGMFVLIDGKILFKKSNSIDWFLSRKFNKDVTLKVDRITYNNINCYKYTVKLTAKNSPIKTIKYIVGINDSFIYSWEVFPKNNIFTNSIEFGNIRQHEVSKSSFALPKNTKIEDITKDNISLVKNANPFVSDNKLLINQLNDALKYTSSLNFSAELQRMSYFKGKKYIKDQLFYQAVSPDGFIYQKFIFDDYTAIKNRNGGCIFSAQKAIRYKNPVISLRIKDIIPKIKGIIITIDEQKYENKGVLLFKVQLPKYYKFGKAIPKEKWPYTRCYLIDRKNSFIYSWEKYNKMGKKFESTRFKKVKQHITFKPNFFAIPANLTVHEVNNPKEISKYFFKNKVNGEKLRKNKDNRLLAKLNYALEKTRNTTFTSTGKGKLTWGISAFKKYYQYKDPKDRFVYKKTEYYPINSQGVAAKKQARTDLLNRNGCYSYSKTKVVKQKQNPTIFWPPREKIQNNINISILSKPIKYKNMECVEYIVRFSRAYNLPESINRNKWPSVRKYIVGKSDSFIYSWSYYTNSGQRIHHEEFENVTFSTPLTSALFKIPDNLSI